MKPTELLPPGPSPVTPKSTRSPINGDPVKQQTQEVPTSRYQVSTSHGDYIVEAAGNPSPGDLQHQLERYDFSKFSDKDLEALAAGDVSKMSDEGLGHIAGATSAPAPTHQAINPRTGLPDLRDTANIPANFDATAQYVLPAIAALVGSPAAGALAASAGNSAVQIRKEMMGEQDGFKPGEAIVAPAAMLASPIPGGGAVRAAGNAAINTGGAYALEKLRSKLDDPAGAPDNAGKAAGIMAAISAASPIASSIIGRLTGNVTAEEAARVAAMKNQNAVKDATLAAGREAGYVVPPSAVNPSWLNKRLESVAGKAALAQEASIRNQAVTNRLASEAIGQPADTAITESVLEQVRKDAAAPYREVASLSPEAAANLEALKQARSDASTYYKHYARSADPSSLKSAKEAGALASRLETGLEATAAAANRPDLIQSLRTSRQLIAKTYNVEGGLNLGDGNISAPALGRALDRGAPLSDELETAAKFQQAFPSYMREGAAVPTPGVSKVEAGLGALLGIGTGAATKNPYLATAAATVPALASPAARSLALSAPYQRMMATRSYVPATEANPILTSIMVRLAAMANAKRQAERAPDALAPAEAR